MLNANLHQVNYGRAFSSQVVYLKRFINIAVPWPLEQSLPSPSDDWHARSRRCQLALDQIVRGTGHLYRPLHSLGDCNLVGNFRFWFRICCFSWNYTSNVFATFSPTCSWQKGDRPDNGDVEPCSIQPKKKLRFRWSDWVISGAVETKVWVVILGSSLCPHRPMQKMSGTEKHKQNSKKTSKERNSFKHCRKKKHPNPGGDAQSSRPTDKKQDEQKKVEKDAEKTGGPGEEALGAATWDEYTLEMPIEVAELSELAEELRREEEEEAAQQREEEVQEGAAGKPEEQDATGEQEQPQVPQAAEVSKTPVELQAPEAEVPEASNIQEAPEAEVPQASKVPPASKQPQAPEAEVPQASKVPPASKQPQAPEAPGDEESEDEEEEDEETMEKTSPASEAVKDETVIEKAPESKKAKATTKSSKKRSRTRTRTHSRKGRSRKRSRSRSRTRKSKKKSRSRSRSRSRRRRSKRRSRTRTRTHSRKGRSKKRSRSRSRTRRSKKKSRSRSRSRSRRRRSKKRSRTRTHSRSRRSKKRSRSHSRKRRWCSGSSFTLWRIRDFCAQNW